MRLFFGLSLPDEIRAATAACAKEAEAVVPGRYALSQNHHVTLAFLGEVPSERLEEARDVLAACAAHFPAPTLTLGALSHFGRAQNAILIIRVQNHPALDALHAQLVHALHAVGLPADPGPFSPHITLARHAAIEGDLPACPPLSFTCAQAHVFESARDSDGILRYTPVFSVPFSN